MYLTLSGPGGHDAPYQIVMSVPRRVWGRRLSFSDFKYLSIRYTLWKFGHDIKNIRKVIGVSWRLVGDFLYFPYKTWKNGNVHNVTSRGVTWRIFPIFGSKSTEKVLTSAKFVPYRPPKQPFFERSPLVLSNEGSTIFIRYVVQKLRFLE